MRPPFPNIFKYLELIGYYLDTSPRLIYANSKILEATPSKILDFWLTRQRPESQAQWSVGRVPVLSGRLIGYWEYRRRLPSKIEHIRVGIDVAQAENIAWELGSPVW